VTDVLVHSGELPPELLARYAAEDAAPVEVDREVLRELGIRVREADLLSKDAAQGVRHDPGRLARRCAGLPSFASEARRQLAAHTASNPGGPTAPSSPASSTRPEPGTRRG
jgi:hypothetical protein